MYFVYIGFIVIIFSSKAFRFLLGTALVVSFPSSVLFAMDNPPQKDVSLTVTPRPPHLSAEGDVEREEEERGGGCGGEAQGGLDEGAEEEESGGGYDGEVQGGLRETEDENSLVISPFQLSYTQICGFLGDPFSESTFLRVLLQDAEPMDSWLDLIPSFSSAEGGEGGPLPVVHKEIALHLRSTECFLDDYSEHIEDECKKMTEELPAEYRELRRTNLEKMQQFYENICRIGKLPANSPGQLVEAALCAFLDYRLVLLWQRYKESLVKKSEELEDEQRNCTIILHSLVSVCAKSCYQELLKDKHWTPSENLKKRIGWSLSLRKFLESEKELPDPDTCFQDAFTAFRAEPLIVVTAEGEERTYHVLPHDYLQTTAGVLQHLEAKLGTAISPTVAPLTQMNRKERKRFQKNRRNELVTAQKNAHHEKERTARQQAALAARVKEEKERVRVEEERQRLTMAESQRRPVAAAGGEGGGVSLDPQVLEGIRACRKPTSRSAAEDAAAVAHTPLGVERVVTVTTPEERIILPSNAEGSLDALWNRRTGLRYQVLSQMLKRLGIEMDDSTGSSHIPIKFTKRNGDVVPGGIYRVHGGRSYGKTTMARLFEFLEDCGLTRENVRFSPRDDEERGGAAGGGERRSCWRRRRVIW